MVSIVVTCASTGSINSNVTPVAEPTASSVTTILRTGVCTRFPIFNDQFRPAIVVEQRPPLPPDPGSAGRRKGALKVGHHVVGVLETT